MSKRCVLAVVCAVAGVATSASAQVTLVSQSRIVAATTRGTTPIINQTQTTSSSGAFSHDLGGVFSLVVSAFPSQPPVDFTARSSQTSDVNAERIRFQGSWQVARYVLTGGGSSAGANTRNTVDVTFSVTNPIPFSLSGVSRDTNPWWNTPSITLRSTIPGSQYLFAHIPEETREFTHNFSTILQPGTYRFLIDFDAGTGQGSLVQNPGSTGYANLTVNLPSPAAAGLFAIAGIAGLRRRR